MDPFQQSNSRQPKTSARWFAAVTIVALLLAGCGRSGPDDAGATATGGLSDALPGAEGDDQTEAQPEAAMAGVRAVSEEPVVAVLPGAADAPTTTATTFPVPASKVYVVQSGDSLSVIADSFDVTIDDIRRANPNVEDIHKIKQGQELVIPAPS